MFWGGVFILLIYLERGERVVVFLDVGILKFWIRLIIGKRKELGFLFGVCVSLNFKVMI